METSGTKSTRSYRPDIDGLRAVAVLSVIFFHLDKNLLPGGFVGVDVFFVISGYLISLHILQELEGRRFLLASFYRRRVKRIAPVMLLVTAVTLAASQLLLIPDDARAAAKSAFWSLLSLANFHFYLNEDTGYFAAATSAKPFLHLWSLGVEEQFYLIWPLLLLLVYRGSRIMLLFAAATAAALASFLAGDYLFPRDPSFVYYMLPTRAGELLLGAIAALMVLRRVQERLPSRLVAPMAVAGLALIGASLLLLREDVVFPGFRAIPPTLGAALLILAGHCGNAWPSRLLALRPLVWVGLISYSAYLWHWPLIAFYRYGHPGVGFAAGSALLGLTLLLAWFSYRYVEQPARQTKASALRVFALQYAVPATILAVLAAVAVKLDGFGPRLLSVTYKSRLAALQKETLPAYEYDYVCQRQRLSEGDTRDTRCILGATSNEPPKALLWGDSNAAHYIGVVAVLGADQGFRFRNIAVGSCPPIFDDPEPFVAAKRLADCRYSAQIVRPLVDRFPVVIISAAWTSYQQRSNVFLDRFFDTARSLAREGKLVILIGKLPVIAGYDRRCREKALTYPFLSCPQTQAPPSMEVSMTNQRLKAFADATANVRYFDVTDYLCSASLCSAFDATGNALYYDTEHLSMQGSWEVGRRVLRSRDGVPEPFTLIANWPVALVGDN